MRILLALLLIAFAPSLRAAPAGDDFVRGNELYTEGKFTDAAAAYENQARRGEYSANLFYNLGNAYFREGDRGRAILNYQRALLLQPGHNEAAANLSFVRGRGVTAPAFGAGGFPSWMDVNAWTILAAVAGWVGVVGLIAAILWRRGRMIAVLASVVGLAISGSSLLALQRLDGATRNPSHAIITEEGTRALYSPADNSKAVVTLPAGREVTILAEEGAWAYIELGDGSRGWVPSRQVERVIPRAANPVAG